MIFNENEPIKNNSEHEEGDERKDENKEASREGDAVEQKETQEKRERTALESFFDVTGKLTITLRERDQMRLNLLLDERFLTGMGASIREGKELLQNKELDRQRINDVIDKIAKSIGQIFQMPRQTNVKENMDSLHKVGFCLSNIQKVAELLAGTISSSAEFWPENSINMIHAIVEDSKNKKAKIIRMRDVFNS